VAHRVVDKIADHLGQCGAVADRAARLDVRHRVHRSDSAQPARLGQQQIVDINVVVA
jgi:hypothetical protein